MRDFLELVNGVKMPIIGLGTGKITSPHDIEKTINGALEIGYRHFDTATGYRNESGIGKVLKCWINDQRCTRKELFLVTKLPLVGMDVDRVEHFLDQSLKNLQVDYTDLYLIHWPVGLIYVDDLELMPRDKDGDLLLDLNTNLEEIWKVMESLVVKGKVKSIGLSNFNEKQIQRILNVCSIPPAVLQVEVHLNFQQNQLREFCSRHGIVVCGYAPLGSPGRWDYINASMMKLPKLLEDPVVLRIGKLHGKSPAQILVRFLIQVLRVSAIPKTTNLLRLKENLQVFDFELKMDDILELKSLDRGEAGRSCPVFEGAKLHPECPF